MARIPRTVDIKTIIVGNEDLDPETTRTVDLSLLFVDESLQASFTWFWSKQEDLITRVSTATGPPTFDNLDALTSSGIELEGKATFLEGWYVMGSYTYQMNKSGDGRNDFTL